MMPRTGWTHLNLKALDLVGPTKELLQFAFRSWARATSGKSLAKDIGDEPQLFNLANRTVGVCCSTDLVASSSKEVRVGITEFIEHLEAPAIFRQQDSFAQAVFKAPAEVFASTPPEPRTFCRHGRRLVVRGNI